MAHVLMVGAGPAGAALAHLLAWRGVQVTLLERQRDFAREFRGEVLLPSGFAALAQIGLGDALEALPRRAFSDARIFLSRRVVFETALDPETFGGLLPEAVSQPALLEMLVSEASKSGALQFERGATLRDLLREGERIVGARVHTSEGEREIRADLVIGADGRASAVSRRGGFERATRDVPMDIVWCKLPCPSFLSGVRGYAGRGHLLIAYRNWDGLMQLAWVILKGTYGELRKRGMEEWVGEMAAHVSDDLAAHLLEHREQIRQPFLLDTQSDCARSWSRDGALLLGDAAHTMSPVGAQGINVALRDAIVAANHLVPVLREPRIDRDALARAAHAFERERRAEIDPVQCLQALPPRVILQRAWWGEVVRFVAVHVAVFAVGRGLGGATVRQFATGATEVRLRV